MKYSVFVLCLCLLAGCSALPRPAPDTELARFHPSPNFAARRPNFVILHHTSSDVLLHALATLSHPLSKVSSHYLIARDGEIFQLVAESERAWHAGRAWWGGQTDMNSASIGIELDNNGREPFPEAQIEALLKLLRDIEGRHNIPRANFLGHADVAPERKSDPSALFPWALLAAEGFGLWCDLPPGGELNLPLASADTVLPDFFLALSALGYDPRTPQSALTAFRLHFYPAGLSDETGTPSAEEHALLVCLLEQKSLADGD